MKVVKISAYLQHNVGDDLMVELLIKRYPNYYFYGSRGMQKKTKLLKKLNYFDLEDIYKRFGRWNHLFNILTFHRKEDYLINHIIYFIEKKCICGVTIGGSLYRQLPGETLCERMKREEERKPLNVPYYIIGANFGPYKDAEFYNAFYSYFSSCNGVSFRDSQSYELFKGLKQVQWAPDVVFNIEDIASSVVENGTLLISVIDLNTKYRYSECKTEYEQFIVKMCKYAISKGLKPILVAFCTHEGDDSAIHSVYKMLDEETARMTAHYYYKGDTVEVIELFKKAEYIIATRFHAMILALKLKKPLFTIAYELKCENVLRDIGSTAFCKINDIARVTPEQALKMAQRIVDVNDYSSAAEKQFAQLDALLRR